MIDNKKKARIIAFYLPQFHPIPENDAWWGKGFTEWTNVGKAKPLFRGHYQPRVPADLGYYDLRMPEVREAQAEMAREAGIEGFCYWHYWFGNGKQLLERPFNEVLKSGKPDFPFCLAWANETWSGIWHGDADRILIEQTYPGKVDYEKHFYEVLPAFKDDRYIKLDGKPMFYIYRPLSVPDSKEFISIWQKLAIKNGLNGIYFVGFAANEKQAESVLINNYDAVNTFWLKDALLSTHKTKFIWSKFSERYLKSKFSLQKYDFKKISMELISEKDKKENYFPTILSGWDNSPRSGKRGRIFVNYTPKHFSNYLKSFFSILNNKSVDKNIVFLKSWNEWAEGNYMEPDSKYGQAYLKILKKQIYNK